MKWHITSWLFSKLDDFLPFVIYVVEWSLHNKKWCFQLIHNSWKTDIIFFQSLNHVHFYWKLQFLIKSGYCIAPSPTTTLQIMEPRLINSITHMTNSRSLNGSPLHKNGKNGNNHHVRFTPDAEKKSAEMAHSGSFLEKHVFEELTIRYYFIS